MEDERDRAAKLERIARRLEEIEKLPQDWQKGCSPKPAEALRTLYKNLERWYHYRGKMYIYPIPDDEGLVSLEWDIGDWSVTCEVNLALQGDFYALNMKTNEESFRDAVNLSENEGWFYLNGLLNGLVQKG